MTVLSIADVNVLLPILVPNHPSHIIAREWLTQQPELSVGWCALTQLGVLRLLSNSRVMGAGVQSPGAALTVWSRLVEAAPFHEIREIPGAHAPAMERLVAGREPSPNLWTDVWLAALAQSLDCEMVTFDRGFRGFSELKLRLLEN